LSVFAVATGAGATALAAIERALELAPFAVIVATPRLLPFADRLPLIVDRPQHLLVQRPQLLAELLSTPRLLRFANRLLLLATVSSRFRGGRKSFLSTPEIFLSTLILPLLLAESSESIFALLSEIFLLMACLLLTSRPWNGLCDARRGSFADLATQPLEVVGADAVPASQRDLINQGKKQGDQRRMREFMS
jgi:hypothetical protein